MTLTIGQRLEQYSLQHPQEVLLVKVEVEAEQDEIAIFKGFSSSLMRATAFDLEIPVLTDKAKILSIDRLASPYDPAKPHYLERGLSWPAFLALLTAQGL
ncbi:MAG: hypothetical protein HC934_12410 [Acaryochloridaceae cyanobacterium SU_2_1]|nr:hypothetical protein [Acaryochloridaceae cyanobacterium SU_2_1]NJM94992.1 hypothetical protein [Acaryochloridaceae cyanobacterium CSU_5_19]